MESAQYDSAPTSESYLGSDEETELETEEESEGEEETTAETEEELDSSRLTDQNEEDKTKQECIISDPSFSMVTVQREDSGITWETSSSRSSTPWASETSLTSDMYSMEGSTVSSPPGNISFILDEGKKVRKRTHKSSSKHGSPALRRKGGKKRHSLEGQMDVPTNAKDKTSISDGKSEQEKSSLGTYDKTRKKKTVSNTPPITGAIYKEHKPLVLRPVYIGTVQYKIKMFNSVKEEIIPLQFYGTLPKGYVIKEINYRKGKDASITLEPDANQDSSVFSKASKSVTQNIESNKEKQLSPPWREAISKESRPMPSFLKDTEKSKEINSFSPPNTVAASGLKHTVSSYSSNEIMEPQSLTLFDSAIPVEETPMNEIQIDSSDAATSELMSPKMVKEDLKAETQETVVLPPTFSTSPSFVDEVGEEERESDLLATDATSISKNLISTKAEQEVFESDAPVTAASAPDSLDTKVENLGLSSLEKEEPVSPTGEWEMEETKPEPPALREMKEEEGDISLPITSGPELESSYVSEEEIIEIDYPESLSPSENAILSPLVHEGEREEAEPDLPLLATSTSENVALLEKEREDIGPISPDSDFASEFSSLSYSTHELEEKEMKPVSPPAALSPSEYEILSEEETVPCSPEFTSVSEYSATSPTAEEDSIGYQSPIHLASTSEAAIFSEEETLESERYTPDSTSASEYSIPPYAAQELQKEETGQRTPLSSIATAEHMIISEEEKDDIGPYSPDSAFVSEYSVSPHPVRESEKEESERDYPIHATSPSEHAILNEEENEEIEPFSPDSTSDFSVPYTTPEQEKRADEPSSLETAMSVSEYSIFSEAEKEEMEPEIQAATMPIPEQTILSQKQKAQHSSSLPEQLKPPPSAAEVDKEEAKSDSQTDAMSVSEYLILSQKQKIESASKVLESEHFELPSSTDEREKEEIRPDSSIPAFMKAGSSEKEKVKSVLPQTSETESQESIVPKSTQEEKKELGLEPPSDQKVASEHSTFVKVSKEEITSSSQVTPPEHPASMLHKEMESHLPRAPDYVMEPSVAPGKAGEKVASDSMSTKKPVPQQEISLKNKENLKDSQQAKSLAGFEISQADTKEKVRQDKEQAAIPKSQHLVSSKSEKEETPHLPELKLSSLSEENKKEIGLDSPQATASELKPSLLPKTVKEEIQSDSPLPTTSVSDAVLSKASKEELKVSSLSEENKKEIGLDSPQATASELKPSLLLKTVKEEIQSESPRPTTSVSDAVLSKASKEELKASSLSEENKKEIGLDSPQATASELKPSLLPKMVKEEIQSESPLPTTSVSDAVLSKASEEELKVSSLSEENKKEIGLDSPQATASELKPSLLLKTVKEEIQSESPRLTTSVSDAVLSKASKEELKVSSLSEENKKEIGLDSPQATASELKPSLLPKTVKEEIQSESPLPTTSVSDAVLSKASKEELKASSLSEENKKEIGLDSPQATASELKPSLLSKTVKEEIHSDSPLPTTSVSDAVLSKASKEELKVSSLLEENKKGIGLDSPQATALELKPSLLSKTVEEEIQSDSPLLTTSVSDAVLSKASKEELKVSSLSEENKKGIGLDSPQATASELKPSLLPKTAKEEIHSDSPLPTTSVSDTVLSKASKEELKVSSLSEENKKGIGLDSPQATALELKPSLLSKTVKEEIQSDSPLPTTSVSDAVLSKASKEELKVSSLSEENKKEIGLDFPQATASELKPSLLPKMVKEEIHSDSPLLTTSVSDAVLSKEKIDLSSSPTDHLVLNENLFEIGSPIEIAAAKVPVWSEVDNEVNLHAPSSARDSAEHAVLPEVLKEEEKPESPIPEHSFLSKVGNDQGVPPLTVPAVERSTLSEKQASESSTPASMTGSTVPPYMAVEMEKKDAKVPLSNTVISVSDQRVTSQEKEEIKSPLHELETLGIEDLSMKSITPTGERSRQEPGMLMSDKSYLLSEKPTVPSSLEPALELSGVMAELSQGLVSENGHRDAKQEISFISAIGSSVLERAKSEAKIKEEGKQVPAVSSEVVNVVSDQSVASFVEKENPEPQQDNFSLKELLEESKDLVASNEEKKQKDHPLTSVGNLVPQGTGDVLTKTNENDVQTPSFLMSQNIPEPSKMASFDLSEEQARQKSMLCPDDIVNLSDSSISSPLVDQKDIAMKSPSFAEANLPLEESKSIVTVEPRDVKDAKESLSLQKEGVWLQKEQSQEQTRPDKERVLESGQLDSSATDGRPLGQLMSVSPEKKQTFEHRKHENIYPAEEPDLSAQIPTSPLGRPEDHREKLTTQTYFSPEIQMAEKPRGTVVVEKAGRPEVNERQFSPLVAPESVIPEKLSTEDIQEKFTPTSESATKMQMQVSGDHIKEKVKPAIIPSSVKATSGLAEDSITVLSSEKEDLRSTPYSSTEKRFLEESKTDTSKVAKTADEVQQTKSEKPKSEVKILMQEKPKLSLIQSGEITAALDSPELINKVPKQAETAPPSTVTDGKAKKGVSSFTSWMASLFFGASAPEKDVNEKEALPSPAADTSVLEGEVKMTVPAIPDDFNEAEKPEPSPLSVSGLLPEKEPQAILIKASEEREQKETPLSLPNQVDKESSKLTALRVEKMSLQTHHLSESSLPGAESRTALTESGKPRQLKEDFMFLSALEEDESQQLSFAKADLFREPQSASVGPRERNKEESYQSPLAKKEKLILERSDAITVSPEEEGEQKGSITDLSLGENNQRTQLPSAGRTNFASEESGITCGISHDETENLKNQTYSLAKAKLITGESQMVLSVAHPEIKETKTVGIQPTSLREKDSLEEKTKTLIPTSPSHRVEVDQENICALPDMESLRSKVPSHSEEKEQHLLFSDTPHAMVEPSKEILPDITKESKKQESQPEFGRLVSRESKSLDSPFDESRSLAQLPSSPEAIFSPMKSPNVISVSSPEVNKSEISSPELTGAGQTYQAKDGAPHSPVPSTFVSKQVSDFQTKAMEDFQVDKPYPSAVHDSNEVTRDMPSTSRKEISSTEGIMKESENLFVKDGAFAVPMVTSKPPGLTEDQKNAFSIISEGCEILNIHAPAFISSVDEEECEKMRDKLEYLEEKTSQSIQPLHDGSEVTEGHEVLRNESLAGDSDVDISLGKGKIQEKTHPAEEDISTDSDVPFNYDTMPSEVDYFEKYTLIDYNISKEPLKKESFQKQDVEGEPQKKIPEETTSFPESSADKTLECEFDLVKLDESFYGMEKEDGKVSYKESQSSLPTLKSTDSETPRDVNRDVNSKSPGMPLFSAEEGVLSRKQLFPMEVKAINPELLEEQPALAFLYKDLYAEAAGDKKKEDETISDKESLKSDGSFPSRHSDAEEETGMYFEKYILKDEILHDASGYQKDRSQPLEEIPVDKNDSCQIKAEKGEVWGRFGTILGEKSIEEEQRIMFGEEELRSSVENHKDKELQGKVPITEEVQLASQKISYAVPFQDTHHILERVDEPVDQANEEENASPEVSQHFPVEVSYPEEESMSGAIAAPERLQVEPQGFVPPEMMESRACSSPVQDEYEFAELMSYGEAARENLLSDDMFSESTPEDVLSQGKESFELVGENAEFMKEEEEQSRSVPQKDLGSEVVEPERPLAEAEDAQKEAKKSQIDTYCYTCKCPISAIDKIFGEHKDHEVAALDTAIDVVKIQLGEFLDNLKEKSLKIEAFVTEIESFFNTIEENCSKNEKRLEEQNEEMMKKVLAQYDEKAQSFEEVKKRKMEYLHEQMVNFLQSMDTAKETLETIVKEAEELDETVFLTSFKEINDRLLSAMESTASLENIPTAFSLFEHYDDRSTRSDQISKHVAVPQPPILEPQEPNSATSTTITVYWSVRKEDVIESFQVYCMEDPEEDSEANDLVEEYRLTVKESYCLFEDLEPGRCYQVWVMAVNFTGCSLPSERAIFRTAPSTPIIKAEDCTVCWNTATIRWSSANPRAADAYTVEYCRQHSPEGEGLRSYSGIKGFQLKVNLQPNDNYFFYAKAVNAFGTSEQSEAALISTRGTRFLLLRETAHPALQISSDGTVIRFTERRRLTETPSVLGEQLPPCGQHYWETTVTDCPAYRLGICSSSNMQGSALGQGDASWYMHCSEPQRYKFFSNGTVSNVHVTEHAVRVGILLDYSNQRLLFINAESGQLLFTIRHRFTGPIHPAFALEKPGQFTLHLGKEPPDFLRHK